MVPTEVRARVKELAQSVSSHCRAANRLLTAVLIVSFFIVVLGGTDQPRVVVPKRESLLDVRIAGKFGFYLWRQAHESGVTDPELQVPFFGLKVPSTDFFSSSFVLLAFLTATFAVSHFQLQVALGKAHEELDQLEKCGKSAGPEAAGKKEVSPRADFDFLLVGSFSRVAPVDQALAQTIRKGVGGVPWVRKVRCLLYVVLKLVYWAAAIVLPIYALNRSWCAAAEHRLYAWAGLPAGIVAVVLLVLVLCVEIFWVCRRCKRMWTGEDEN
jgi:hypothetical protein